MTRAPICELCGSAMPVYRSMSICEQCQADAKLGRVVHKVLQSAYNLRLTKSDDGLVFSAALYINGPRVGDGDTLLAALEAVGITDD